MYPFFSSVNSALATVVLSNFNASAISSCEELLCPKANAQIRYSVSDTPTFLI